MPLSKNNKLKGNYTPPGDKSISHRIIILGSQIVGQSTISNLLGSSSVYSGTSTSAVFNYSVDTLGDSFTISEGGFPLLVKELL